MTQIDFYTHVANKQQVACILSAKALDKGLRVMIYTADAGATEQIDRLLWTTPATGFIPHCRGSDALAPLTPVTIDHEPAAFVHEDVLLNLHPQWPPFFSRFQRLIEIVGLDEEDRRNSRERFRFYRDRGYEIRTHDLSRSE